MPNCQLLYVLFLHETNLPNRGTQPNLFHIFSEPLSPTALGPPANRFLATISTRNLLKQGAGERRLAERSGRVVAGLREKKPKERNPEACFRRHNMPPGKIWP